jgi:hypothetical protein
MACTAAIARENGKKGGRPLGPLAKLSRRKADELSHKNETPLDVMIDNMNFWRGKATELSDEMQRRMDEISKLDISDAAQRDKFVELMKEFNKIATAMLAARAESQKCAVDAAPYVHPRFQSIAIKHTQTNVLIEMALAPPGGGEITFDAEPPAESEAATIEAVREPESAVEPGDDDGFEVELPATGTEG